ncbi:hypothetical protein GEMRC1_006024 [Eukaryota sp. GEM-RC1]
MLLPLQQAIELRHLCQHLYLSAFKQECESPTASPLRFDSLASLSSAFNRGRSPSIVPSAYSKASLGRYSSSLSLDIPLSHSSTNIISSALPNSPLASTPVPPIIPSLSTSTSSAGLTRFSRRRDRTRSSPSTVLDQFTELASFSAFSVVARIAGHLVSSQDDFDNDNAGSPFEFSPATSSEEFDSSRTVIDLRPIFDLKFDENFHLPDIFFPAFDQFVLLLEQIDSSDVDPTELFLFLNVCVDVIIRLLFFSYLGKIDSSLFLDFLYYFKILMELDHALISVVSRFCWVFLADDTNVVLKSICLLLLYGFKQTYELECFSVLGSYDYGESNLINLLLIQLLQNDCQLDKVVTKSFVNFLCSNLLEKMRVQLNMIGYLLFWDSISVRLF